MKRGTRLTRLLPWLLLAAAYLVTVGWFALNGAHNLDADMSSEMILAQLQNQEGTLLTRNWYYSSELRVVSPVPLYQLGLLLFPQNWHAARTFGTALMLAGIIAAFLYFARRVKMGEMGVYMAAILAMPFSSVYAYVGFFNGGYSVYLMLVFVLLGLILGMDRARHKAGCLLAIALLSLWGGAGGVRMMLFLAVPLAAAYAVEVFDALRRHERIAQAMEPALFWPLLGAAVAAVMTAAGYVINEKVLSRLFDYMRYDQMGLSMPESGMFFAQLTGIAEFFGCRETTQMFSARGIASLLALCMMGVSLLVLAELLLRRREGRLSLCHSVLLLFTVFSVLLGVVINALTENYFARYFLPGLLMLVVMILVAWQNTQCRSALLRRAVPLALCAVFALESAIYLRQEQSSGTAAYEEAAEWLVQNGFTQGYATFWNAATLTEASSGAIEVYTMTDSYWEDDWKKLELNRFLQKKSHFSRVSDRRQRRGTQGSAQLDTSRVMDGKFFVLLSGRESAQKDVPYANEAHLVYTCAAGNIYAYESVDALYDTIEETP